MKEGDQINAFHEEMTRLINRYRDEFTLSAAAIIGTLEFKKLELFQEWTTPTEDP